jgi:hypothetical protein
LLLLSGGEYADKFQIGVFRAEQDIDLDALASQFAMELDHLDPDLEHHRINSMITVSDVMPTGCDGGYDPGAVLFSKWLVEKGFITRLPVSCAHLQTTIRQDSHAVFARVTLDENDEPTLSSAP